MLNHSRSQLCPTCRQPTSWDTHPAPHPEDVLYCQICRTPISTYDQYIKSMIHQEVERLMTRFGGPDMALPVKRELGQRPQSEEWVRPTPPCIMHWPHCSR